jgi:hypothetical protein
MRKLASKFLKGPPFARTGALQRAAYRTSTGTFAKKSVDSLKFGDAPP